MSNMKEKQELASSIDKNDYEKVPVDDISPKIEEKSQIVGNRRLQYAATMSVCFFSMTFGTMSSWTSPALPYLKSNISEIPITDIEGSWIATLFEGGAFFGNIAFLLPSRFLGRKYWILMLGVPYLISWLMIIFAKNIFSLYASRIISGAADFAGGLIPMYIGEIADKEIRGILLIGPRILSNLGHMYVKSVGAFFSYQTMNIMMFFVPVSFFVTFLFMPESPYYLLLQNREEEALKTLMKLKGVKNAEMVRAELKRIQNTVKESQENERREFRELFCLRGNRKSLLIVIIAWTTKYSSGYSSIIAYTQEIFEDSGTHVAPEICSLILATLGVIMAMVATLIIERAGRRKTLFFSGLFCTLGLSIVGLFFFLKIYLLADVKSITWLPLFGLIVYEIAFSLGLAYVPLILMGEMFALNVKMPAAFCINFSMCILTIFVKAAFQWINDSAGIYTNFWVYAFCTFFGSIIFFLIAPETKGKTLEEIQENLHAKNVDKINKDTII